MRDRPAARVSLPKIALWYVLLVLVAQHAMGGLVGLSTDFLLKDRLRLGPESMARYGAVLALPGYAAFLFGLARDRWATRGRGDRELAMWGIGAAALAYGLLALSETTYPRLLAAALASIVAASFVDAAWNGAFVGFGTRRGVTDRLSGFSLAVGTCVAALVSMTAGWGAAHVAYRALVGVSVGLRMVYLAFLRFAPRGVFEPRAKADPASPMGSMRARFADLVRSRPYLAALGFTIAYNFGPASGSATFFYYTDVLKAGPQLLGATNAVFNLATVPIALLYARFARRFPLRRTMAVAMTMIFLQPFLFFALRTQADLLPVSALFGATNAVFLAAVVDLLLRSIPKGSEGLGFAVYGTVGLLTLQVSNLIGSRVYAAHGLAPCVWLTFPVAVLGFPLLALVPWERGDIAVP